MSMSIDHEFTISVLNAIVVNTVCVTTVADFHFFRRWLQNGTAIELFNEKKKGISEKRFMLIN